MSVGGGGYGKPLELVPLRLKDGRRHPKRPWLIPDVLMKGHITLLAGPGSGGKSLAAKHIAVACATGRPWLSFTPTAPTRVLLLSVEDDQEEEERRLIAVCRQMGVSAGQIDGKIELVAGSGHALVARGMKGAPIRTAFYHQLAAVRAERFGLIVLDPLVSMHEGLDENSNSDVQALASALRDLSRLAPQCPVLVVHHTRKDAHAGDVNSVRGAGAIVNAARIVWGLSPMTDKQAREVLTASEFRDRWRYACMTLTKGNYSRRGSEQWLQLCVHDIGNGDETPAWDGWDPGVEIDPSVVEESSKGNRGSERWVREKK